MHTAIGPLGGHAVFLLLMQLVLLLAVARLGAEFVKRLGLPSVVGELAAGILLGPTVFGHYLPFAFHAVFPAQAEQFHLLEVVGTLGMVLLLLLTGLETDLRLLKNLGRAALIASGMGMLVPFGLGFALGWLLPSAYLAQPDHRTLFSMFLATSMAISAMPVIAKILLDLDLMKRNIGLVIMSAGVVDDTAGWLILSLIAGAATRGAVHFAGLLVTVGLMLAFLAASWIVLWPLLRLAMRVAQRFKTPETDLVLIVAVTFVCAAATEWIGVHAVFGAFVIGTVLRQVQTLSAETIHKLEAFVFSILAPVFFGIVGLRVDLWTLGDYRILAVVLGVAMVGKFVGCGVGGAWGGLNLWESLSIAVAMNARGAMELVVATIGLGLGILNQQMFSVIVMVAIVTSFMAPVGLRITMRKVRMTDEEARRILAEQTRGAFDPARVKVLVPTAGGPNAIGAAQLAMGIAKRSETPPEIVFIDAKTPWWRALLRLSKPDRDRTAGINEHFATIGSMKNGGKPPRMRRAVGSDVPGLILEEARKGFDLVMLGASEREPIFRGGGVSPVGGRIIEAVVHRAPCHVAIVRGATSTQTFQHLLVPIDGRAVTRLAAELALRYAESVGASLTLATLAERRPTRVAHDASDSGAYSVPPPGSTPEQELERISTAFSASEVKPEIVRLPESRSSNAIAGELASGKYDLIVLGTENRAIQHRLYFGYENEKLIRESKVPVVVLVPNVRRLG